MHSERSLNEGTDRRCDVDVSGSARAAADAVQQLARLTVDRPSLTPAEVDVVLAHLAEAVAALPQVAAQLGDVLDRAQDDYRLTMDSMTATVDTGIAIDTARLHLDGVREPAVQLYRRLDEAKQETAHIIAGPRDIEFYESRPPSPGELHRPNQAPPRPDVADRRTGPAR